MHIFCNIMTTTLAKFNETVVQFVDDLKKLFGKTDPDILAMETMCDVMKLNARIIIKPFQHYILGNPDFVQHINQQNINYFLNCQFETVTRQNQHISSYIEQLVTKFKEAALNHKEDTNTIKSFFNWFKVMIYYAYLDEGKDPVEQINAICSKNTEVMQLS